MLKPVYASRLGAEWVGVQVFIQRGREQDGHVVSLWFWKEPWLLGGVNWLMQGLGESKRHEKVGCKTR